MRRFMMTIMTAILSLAAVPAFAQTQDGQDQPTAEELAAKEAERLERLLGLEGWQVFYVDSTLQHDYKALQDEFKQMSSAKVDNYDLYNNVRDKWMEQIDNSYKKYFTEEQWKKYLKQGAAKAIKAREKRRAKAEKNK